MFPFSPGYSPATRGLKGIVFVAIHFNGTFLQNDSSLLYQTFFSYVLNCILVYKIRIECVFRTCWRSTALIAAAKKVASTKQRSKRARINFCRSPSHIYGRGTYKTSSIEFSLGPPHGSPAPLTGLRPSPLRGGGQIMRPTSDFCRSARRADLQKS